jgi:hypothetical protein
LAPEFKNGRVQIWEIDYILAAAAGAVLDANLFAMGRSIDVGLVREISRKRVKRILTRSIGRNISFVVSNDIQNWSAGDIQIWATKVATIDRVRADGSLSR